MSESMTANELAAGLKLVLEEGLLQLTVVVTRQDEEVEGARVSVDPGPDGHMWSEDCQRQGRDQDCSDQVTDARGQATFYYSSLPRELTLHASVNGKRETMQVDDPESVGGTFDFELEPTGGDGSGGAVGAPIGLQRCPPEVVTRIEQELTSAGISGPSTVTVRGGTVASATGGGGGLVGNGVGSYEGSCRVILP